MVFDRDTKILIIRVAGHGVKLLLEAISVLE